MSTRIGLSSLFLVGALTSRASADAAADAAAALEKLQHLPLGTEVEAHAGSFMTMYQMQVKPTAKDGWNHARSTHGGFTVDLPAPYNDLQMRAKTTDSVELAIYMLGGEAAEVKWVATCMVRKDGTLSPAGQEPLSGDHTVPMGDPIRAYTRTVVLDKRACVMTVEATGSAAVPDEKARTRFFSSLQITKPKKKK